MALRIVRIDSFHKRVEAVPMENDLHGIYAALGADIFTHGLTLPNKDVLLVDQEALVRKLLAPPTGFMLDGVKGAQVFFGNGLLVYMTPGGSYKDAKSTIEYVEARLKFPEQKDLNAHFLHYSGRPASDILDVTA